MSGDQSIRHDCAVALAKAIVEIFLPLLRQEEYRDAFDEVHAAVKAGLTCYDLRRDRMSQRLNPSNN